jgi:hypothetical protein
MKPAPQQLAAAKRLLKEAVALITDAKSLLQSLGELQAVQRLDAVRQRLVDEVETMPEPPGRGLMGD